MKALRHLQQADSEFALAVLHGLAQPQKTIPPKYFYDREGSELFERICRCPEYYLTRAELLILERHAPDLARLAGPRAVLIEPGSGASVKTRLILDCLTDAAAYVPIEISREMLRRTSARLARDYPRLRVIPVAGDFTRAVHLPAAEFPVDSGRRVVFFPGSTLGNFDPPEAWRLLVRLAHLAAPGGLVVLGVDLVKAREELEAAYNDAQGVTAAFNRNLLRRLRDELGAALDLEGFAHRAFFNDAQSRIEMHLVAQGRQVIRVLGREFELAAGETIHTESSYKYTEQSLTRLAADAGLKPQALWTDARRLFVDGVFEAG